MDQQPSTIPQAPPSPQGAPSQPTAEKTTDVLGIISIVFAFIGLQPFGFILGLVGASKAKKEGRSPSLSKIGWILNLVFMLLVIPLMVIVFISFNAAQNKAQETLIGVQKEAQSSLEASENQMPSKLEYAKGETAKFGSLSVSISNVTRNYVPQSSYSRAEEGKELIVLDVAVTNSSEKSEYISKYDFGVETDGLLEDTSYVQSPGKELPSGELAPGASTSGQLVFEVSAGKTGLNLAYQGYVVDDATYETKEVIYKLAF